MSNYRSQLPIRCAHQYCARQGRTVSPRCRLVPSPRKSGASDGRVEIKAKLIRLVLQEICGQAEAKSVACPHQQLSESRTAPSEPFCLRRWFSKLGALKMGRTQYAWRKVYLSALRESDPEERIARIKNATTALERRYAEWGTTPGTPAELKAIRKAISDLQGLLKEKQASRRAS